MTNLVKPSNPDASQEPEQAWNPMSHWSAGDIHRTLAAKRDLASRLNDELAQLHGSIGDMAMELSRRLKLEIEERHTATGDAADPLVVQRELGSYR